MKAVVYHTEYGCETGCCGHKLSLVSDDVEFESWGEPADVIKDTFVFSHPYSPTEDVRKWAEDMIREAFGDEHVKDLDWEHCILSDD